MKKTWKKIRIFLVFSILLSAFALPTWASTVYEDLIRLDMPQKASEIHPSDLEVCYNHQGKMTAINSAYLDNDCLEYLLSTFSDNNLNFVSGAMITLLPEEEYPKNGYFRFIVHKATEEYQWEIHFDENRVYIWKRTIESWNKFKDQQGWFTYKDIGTYRELVTFLEDMTVKSSKDDEQEKNDEQQKEEMLSVYNVKFLYTAFLPLENNSKGLWWGVLSYVRDGETTPVTAPYIGESEPNTDAFQRYYLADRAENNTVYFDMEKALTGKGKELKENSHPGTWTHRYKLQANVDKDGTVNDLIVDYTHIRSGVTDTLHINMTHYRQSGTLPQSGPAAFLPENNALFPESEAAKSTEPPKPAEIKNPEETAPPASDEPKNTQAPDKETPEQSDKQSNTSEDELQTIATASPFSDIKGHWAENAINEWENQGLLTGYPDGTFRPDEPITRAEFAKVITLAFDLQEDNFFDYTDLDSTGWYYPYLKRTAKYIPVYAFSASSEDNIAYQQNAVQLEAEFLPDISAMRIHVAEA